MKKKISLILAFLMAATMLAGCKKTDEESAGLPEVTTEATVSLTQMTTEATEATTVPEVTEAETEETTEETTVPEETEATTEETTTVSETTAASETTTAATTKAEKDWNETEISETLYIKTSCYSRTHAIVGSESVKKYSAGTKINIVAATDTGYYKLADGTFIHSDYVTDEKPAETTKATTSKKQETPDDNKSTNSKPISSSYKTDYEDRYAYQQLTSAEQQLYANIVEAAENFNSQVEIPDGIGDTELFRVYCVLYNNEPQLFWLKPSLPTKLGGMLMMDYAFDRYEAEEIQEEIDATVKSVMKKVGGYTSTVSRIKAIYDWVVLNTDFSLQSSYITCGIYGGLTDNGGTLQCQGYAKTFHYLCDIAGIECITVSGNNYEGNTHAWNIVYCDNGYYIVDTTWGDPTTDYGSDTYIRYLFLLANDEMTENTHLYGGTKINTVTNERITLFEPPACKKTACYYFKAYGEEYSDTDSAIEALKADIKKAVKNKENVAHIRVTDKEIWDELRTKANWKLFQDYAKSLDDDVAKIKQLTLYTEDVLVVQYDIVYD